eukprot:PhM_4_TR11744/c0_g1_i1/m.78159
MSHSKKSNTTSVGNNNNKKRQQQQQQQRRAGGSPPPSPTSLLLPPSTTTSAQTAETKMDFVRCIMRNGTVEVCKPLVPVRPGDVVVVEPAAVKKQNDKQHSHVARDYAVVGCTMSAVDALTYAATTVGSTSWPTIERIATEEDHRQVRSLRAKDATAFEQLVQIGLDMALPWTVVSVAWHVDAPRV